VLGSMVGCLKGCAGRLLAVVLLVAAAYAGWRWGPSVFPRLERMVRGESAIQHEGEASASPELAESTLDRFERFLGPDGREPQLMLGDAELSSLVRFSLPGILPPGVSEPAIELSGGRIFLSARVALDAFPELPSFEEVVGLLPDTVPIRMSGSLGPRDPSSGLLYVDAVEAARIPVPDRFIPAILSALGREDRDGLPPNAMVVPLPKGLSSVYVRRDSLVLVADR